MQFNISYEQALGSLPAGFVNAINYVVNYFDHLFTDPITINLQIGYGTLNGGSLDPGALGENISLLNNFSYSTIRNAVSSDGRSPDDASVLANNLPVGDPIGGTHNYWLTQAQTRALGLSSGSGVDGYVGFDNSVSFDYDRNNGISSGAYDFIGVAEHEISEVMGRILLTGVSIGGFTNSYDLFDLFDYSSAGVRRLVGTNTGYFSVDGGTTNLDNFNTISGGDFGDWAASAGNDMGLAFSGSGIAHIFSSVDVRAMDVLGYDRAPATTSDFQGNGVSDILFFNASNGGVGDFDMSTGRASWAGIGAGAAGWSVVGVGDFNGDRTSDILWYNSTTGGIGDFVMHNGQPVWSGIGAGSAGWNAAGVGDFNHDGTSDILWYNSNNGGVGAFLMNNGQPTWSGIGAAAPGWNIAGVGDFNGDGTSDILWYNPTTSGVGAFLMNNGQPTWAGIGVGPSGSNIASVGDYNGDGTSDILWRNPTTGSISEFLMNNGQATLVAVGNSSTSWQIIRT